MTSKVGLRRNTLVAMAVGVVMTGLLGYVVVVSESDPLVGLARASVGDNAVKRATVIATPLPPDDTPLTAAAPVFEVVPSGLRHADFTHRGYRQWLEGAVRDSVRHSSPWLDARLRPAVVAALLRYRETLDRWLRDNAEVKRRGADALVIDCPIMASGTLVDLQTACLGELDDLLGQAAATRLWDEISGSGDNLFNIGSYPITIRIEASAQPGIVETRESKQATILGMAITAWGEGRWMLESSPYAYASTLLSIRRPSGSGHR